MYNNDFYADIMTSIYHKIEVLEEHDIKIRLIDETTIIIDGDIQVYLMDFTGHDGGLIVEVSRSLLGPSLTHRYSKHPIENPNLLTDILDCLKRLKGIT